MKKLMLNRDKDISYSSAGGVCSEAVANVRTVAAFGFEDRLTKLFDVALGSGLRTAIRYALKAVAHSIWVDSIPFVRVLCW